MLGQLPLAIQRNLHSCLLKNNIFLMEAAGFALNMPFDLTQTMGDSKMCQAHSFFPTLPPPPRFTPLPLFHYSREKKKRKRFPEKCTSWTDILLLFWMSHCLSAYGRGDLEWCWMFYGFLLLCQAPFWRLIYSWQIRPQRSNAEPLLTFKRLCFKMPRICPRQMLLPKVDLKRRKKKKKTLMRTVIVLHMVCKLCPLHSLVPLHYTSLYVLLICRNEVSKCLQLLQSSLFISTAKLYPLVHLQKQNIYALPNNFEIYVYPQLSGRVRPWKHLKLWPVSVFVDLKPWDVWRWGIFAQYIKKKNCKTSRLSNGSQAIIINKI